MSANWACESESEDEVQETIVETKETPVVEWPEDTAVTGFENIEFADKTAGASGIKIKQSRYANESDSEEEEQEAESLNIDIVSSAAPAAPKKVTKAPLSKKEKEALRQKEMDDFSALLEELGVTDAPAPEAPVVEAAPAAASDDKKKKRKAKKPTEKKVEAAPAVEVSPEIASANITELLKARQQAKGSKNSKTSAQNSALAAALEASKDDKKKKKLDKSKFSEGTY